MIISTATLWGTYPDVRELLADQYTHGRPFNPESGLTASELQTQFNLLNEQNTALPRIIQRAHQLEFMLHNAQLRIDPEDWFADHLCTPQLLWNFREVWRREAAKLAPRCQAAELKAGFPILDLSHTTPSWRRLLKYGFNGIAEQAEHLLLAAKDDEARDFYTAVSIVYRAAAHYARRLADEARRIGAVRVIDTLDAIADHAPETFHQALQLGLLANQVQEIEGEYVRSQGIFDQLYYPYYQHDIDNGTLTREHAKELVNFLFDKYAAQHFGANKNFCFGGRTPDGKDLTNPLTDIAFECFAERQNIDPKFSFRVHKNTPQERLEFMANCVKNGSNAIVFANDDVAYDMFTRRGKRPEDVIDFVPIGCYEPAIMGKELSCTMSATVNLVKIIELLFAQDFVPQSFDEVIATTKRLLGDVLTETMDVAKFWEQCWPQINPCPFLSGSMESPLAKGRDGSHSGTQYSTSGIVCIGIGTFADALAAIQYAVFQKHLLDWTALKAVLASNWEGHEKLRTILKRKAPKWGNNNTAVDTLATDFVAFCANLINHTPNSKGGTFQLGLWSIDLALQYGKMTGATPDGRLAGDMFSKNLSPTIGADTEGVTAILLSAAKFDHAECPDGSVLDIMLHPSAVSGPDGHKTIVNLIRSYFQRGGLFIQFNIVNAETLKDAQANPDKHRNLQVRVCGWNTRFVDLSHQFQDAFIAEAENQ